MLNQWIKTGLSHINAKNFTEKQIDILANALTLSDNKRIVRSYLFNFNLFLTGEESTSIFDDMQLSLKTMSRGLGVAM